MPSVQRRVLIPATTPQTWTCIADFASMHTWFAGVRSVELLSPGPAQNTLRLLTLITGQSHLERIGEWAPPMHLTVEVLEPPRFARDFRGRVSLTPEGRETLVEWRIDWESRLGLVGRLFNWLLVRPVIDLALRLSLVRLRGELSRRLRAQPV